MRRGHAKAQADLRHKRNNATPLIALVIAAVTLLVIGTRAQQSATGVGAPPPATSRQPPADQQALINPILSAPVRACRHT